VSAVHLKMIKQNRGACECHDVSTESEAEIQRRGDTYSFPSHLIAGCMGPSQHILYSANFGLPESVLYFLGKSVVGSGPRRCG